MTKRAGAPPTIIDVARKAGVSIKTVSRVMNKEPTVHADTRARVLEAVAALNYRPQLSARSLAGARSFLIGLLYYDPSAAFVASVQQGATRGCRDAGRHLVVESLQTNGVDVHAQIEAMLAALRPDGMILIPPLCDNPTILEVLRAHRTPCVLISPAEDGHGMARVHMDDALAAEELTNLLISLGHTAIAFIEGDQWASGRRRHGYERALKAHGIAVDPALVVPGTFQFESGVAAARTLFALPHPPTAIFAANDDMALGALTEAQRLGLSVPHDVAIVGFDDSRAATLVWPELTTVRQPLAEMAMAAVGMLLSGEAQADERHAAPVRVLPHELVVRGSSAAPPRGARLSELAFRRATIDDIPAMSRIRLAVRENALSNPARITETMYRHYLDALGRGWVAELDGEIIGFSYADRTDASIWALFVDPAREGLGAGSRLLRLAADWLFEIGNDEVRLGTQANTRADRFYAAQGWTREGMRNDIEVGYRLRRTV